MNNQNQSAVEWLEEQLSYDNGLGVRHPSHNEMAHLNDYFNQAKEMESQKDAKYNEMLEMLKDLLESWEVGNFDNEQFVFVKQLIKEATILP
jgi:uncharacterized UPF0160 family protein